ncbi:MAG: AAA family ATPase [Coprobacillaceae bacterium]
MKNLIMINGTMGVGKTTISQRLKKQLPNSVFLDGDWCWDASPFIVTKETKEMVVDNITYLINNFLSCNEYQNIIFCWVMDEQQIIDTVLSKVSLPYNLYTFTLMCDEVTLKQRIQKDIDQGIRTNDAIKRSIERLTKYEQLSTTKINVSNKTIEVIVKEIEEELGE